MECDFCGKETMNKYNNQPRCKSHVTEARRLRDEHNDKVKENLTPDAYAITNILSQYIPSNPLEGLMRTTAGYHLNKMYKELEVKPSDAKAKAHVDHNKKVDAGRF